MKACSEIEIHLHSFLSSELNVRCQFHVTAALPHEERTTVTRWIGGRFSGPRAGLNTVGKRKFRASVGNCNPFVQPKAWSPY